MKLFLVFCFFALTNFCQAQSPLVLWTGTTTVDLSTGSTPLESQRSKQVVYRSPETGHSAVTDIDKYSIGTLMLFAFQEGRLNGFQEQDLKEPFTEESFRKLTTGLDTIMIVDPTSYETKVQVVARETNPEDFEKLRIFLRLTFLADGTLQQQVTAVAISESGKFSDRPTIYFSPDALAEAIDLKNVGWNEVIRTSVEIPFDQLLPSTDNQLSLTETFSELTSLILRTDGRNFSNTMDWGPTFEEEVQALGGGIDTVPIVDPDTYAVTYSLVERRSLPEAVDALRLYQYWAWDDDAARLTFSPIGYAPLTSERDDEGNLRFRYPLINWAAPWYRRRN